MMLKLAEPTRTPASGVPFEPDVPIPIGLPKLAKAAFDGNDLAPVWNTLVMRARDNPGDAAAYLDLSTIAHLQGRPADRLALQALALELGRIYRQPAWPATGPLIHALAFLATGDFLANMPIEFLLEGSNVMLDMIYVEPDRPLPPNLPDHDVAIVAVSESHENKQLLLDLDARLRSWPRPVVNAPGLIARLTRDGTWDLLKSAPGIVIPMNVRAQRLTLKQLAAGHLSVDTVLPGATFPIIARPLDSHAGQGLAKLDDPAAIEHYLSGQGGEMFYVSPFVDYRSGDGKYRKYRVALIDGKAYAVHMATSTHWMVHYLNADMMMHGDRRDEEARFMATFERDFAVRHAAALDAITQSIRLDYVPFDCAELPDGRLLIFEIGTNMIVHAMDPHDLFPYKRPQMQTVFRAFEMMLQRACSRDSDRLL